MPYNIGLLIQTRINVLALFYISFLYNRSSTYPYITYCINGCIIIMIKKTVLINNDRHNALDYLVNSIGLIGVDRDYCGVWCVFPVPGKVMEKIILQRIRWSAKPPNTRATGFKPGSGTRDTVSILLYDISSFLSRRRRGAVVYLDLQKAFEQVNKDVIFAELAITELHCRMLAQISDFLTDRSAKVRFKTAPATLRVLGMALPKKALLFQLFNNAMNMFQRLELPEGFES